MYGPGAVLADRYRLDERVGAGGMGEVWRATDEVLDRTVAVKLMRRELLEEPGFAQRFLFEARTMATIKHNGVVAVHDYHGDPDTAFLVMEYVEGESLARRLHRFGTLDPTRTMSLLAKAADALQAAHDKGVVHRDIKPGNLLVTADDHLVLTDFGIARSAANTPLTATGAVVGTPSYIAPEQVLGKPATPSSDVYALGVVAYECLTGRPPFDGDNPFEIAMKRLQEPAPTIAVDAPPPVLAVVERALAAEPEQRYASATELAAAARQAIAPRNTTEPNRTPSSTSDTKRQAGPDAAAGGTDSRAYAAARVPMPGPSSPMPPAPAPAHPTTIDRRPPTSPPPAPVPSPTPAPYLTAPPYYPTQPPAWPGRPRPPFSLFLANLLLSIAGVCLAAFSLANAAVMDVVVDRTADYYGPEHETVVSVKVFGWALVAAVGLLAFFMLLLAGLNHRGSRAARAWSFVLGSLTLCCCAPGVLIRSYVSAEVDPGYEDWLPGALPVWYEPVISMSAVVGVGALLLALVLLMVPPTNRYFRYFRPQPRAPYYYYPYPYYHGYPPRP